MKKLGMCGMVLATSLSTGLVETQAGCLWHSSDDERQVAYRERGGDCGGSERIRYVTEPERIRYVTEPERIRYVAEPERIRYVAEPERATDCGSPRDNERLLDVIDRFDRFFSRLDERRCEPTPTCAEPDNSSNNGTNSNRNSRGGNIAGRTVPERDIADLDGEYAQLRKDIAKLATKDDLKALVASPDSQADALLKALRKRKLTIVEETRGGEAGNAEQGKLAPPSTQESAEEE
ncbi:MAG: hypothetical protein H0T47_12175 [Planctomycetaceae bacterium]|nr:hypothetical protein [Planctomycetaceae bacterium]